VKWGNGRSARQNGPIANGIANKAQQEMGLNLKPDQQHVIVVASRIPFDTADRTEAAEIVFSGVAGMGADELLNETVQIVEPAQFYYEEQRRRKEWGSSGAEFQEIVIHFAADVGSGITVAALLGRLKALRDRREKEGQAQGVPKSRRWERRRMRTLPGHTSQSTC
jgi:hypothetical protein